MYVYLVLSSTSSGSTGILVEASEIIQQLATNRRVSGMPFCLLHDIRCCR